MILSCQRVRGEKAVARRATHTLRRSCCTQSSRVSNSSAWMCQQRAAVIHAAVRPVGQRGKKTSRKI